MSGGEQKYERVELLGEVRGEVMVYQPITVTQVSEGGARIETSFPLHLDALHNFRLTLNDTSVVVKARIVHCRICEVDQEGVTYRAGIEFIEPSEYVRQAVSDFIREIKDSRQGL